MTGETAVSKDFNDLMAQRMPLVVGFVLLLAFGLLLVAFRSIVIAGEGDRPQPAVGGRRLRAPRGRLPVGLGREHPRLRLDRGDHRDGYRSSCS